MNQINYFQKLIHQELIGLINSTHPKLTKILHHHLGWDGNQSNNNIFSFTENSNKIIYPFGSLFLATIEALNKKIESYIFAACSLELINSFIQIHEDVGQGKPLRDNRNSTWWKWGPGQAINAGDALHSLARIALLKQQNSNSNHENLIISMQYIDQNIFDLCSFSFQKANQPDLFSTSVDDFINNEILETCSLYKCSMELAGLLLPCKQLIKKQLEKSGESLGKAISINKHISELSQTEENVNQNNSDILNKKKNLPILFAIEMANKNDLDLIKKIYQKRMLDFSDLKTLNSIVEKLNIYNLCYDLTDKYYIKAKDISFLKSPDSVLFNLIDILIKSNKAM
ncbi:MAG: hypothetical protein FI728_04450 [SAR202 cluster bacterium]|nr:hypothetical protein [SAR202 cluster bacterium]|tara:strand:+ start:2297 stop:3322 length:1026 start_codon:yes stop_codon:yes gene_type:complete